MFWATSGSLATSTDAQSAGIMVGVAFPFLAACSRVRREKAYHSLPHHSLVKYRGEYSGTKTRQLPRASDTFRCHSVPDCISRSMKPTESAEAAEMLMMSSH